MARKSSLGQSHTCYVGAQLPGVDIVRELFCIDAILWGARSIARHQLTPTRAALLVLHYIISSWAAKPLIELTFTMDSAAGADHGLDGIFSQKAAPITLAESATFSRSPSAA